METEKHIPRIRDYEIDGATIVNQGYLADFVRPRWRDECLTQPSP